MVKSSDSLVVLEKIKENETRITVFNFFDPDLGILHSVAEGKIWNQAMEEGYRDELNFRAKVEHPDWDLEQIEKETAKMMDQHPLKKVEYATFPELQ
jgi:hypothetical protein